MLVTILLITTFSLSLFADNHLSGENLYEVLVKGDYRERKQAVNSFASLSKEELSDLKEKLKKSKDPELIRIFEENFQKIDVFQGTLGIYEAQLVMSLIREGDQVKGSYYYSRHQKPLQLSGKIDKKSGILKITERYKGKVTGHFEGKIEEGVFKGDWFKAKERKEVHKFSFRKVHIAKENRRFTKYSKTFKMFLVGEEEPVMVKTILKVSSISEKTFSFYYEVYGQNGHSGSMQGLATVTEPGVAVFYGKEGAQLIFKFTKNSVETVPNDKCRYYCGTRASLAWELSEEK